MSETAILRGAAIDFVEYYAAYIKHKETRKNAQDLEFAFRTRLDKLTPKILGTDDKFVVERFRLKDVHRLALAMVRESSDDKLD